MPCNLTRMSSWSDPFSFLSAEKLIKTDMHDMDFSHFLEGSYIGKTRQITIVLY